MDDEIRGFSLPFRIDPATGSVAQESGAEKLKENIIHILLTGVGERVMKRDYGGGVRQLLHDPNSVALQAIIQHQVAKSIGKWEPRVLLQKVSVRQQDGQLYVDIRYIIRRTQRAESLSVPIGLGGI